MNDFAPLGRRIGYKDSDRAWRAHEVERAGLLRERFGPLFGDRDYPDGAIRQRRP
jgi:hypothetical protein